MSEEVKRNLERLKTTTQADSLSEVLRRALAVYDFLWVSKMNGETAIVRTKEGKERELVLL
jgi:hypothetical protein